MAKPLYSINTEFVWASQS